MTEPLRPAGNKAYARENWIFVTAIAASTLIPTVAEMTAGTVLDVTNIVFAEGAPDPSMSTERVKRERRLGDTKVTEFIGETTYEGGDISYQFNPQAAALSDGKKLREKIPEGTTGFLVRRLGVPKATAVAAGQFVDVYPVEFGPSMTTKVGTGASAETAAKATYAITDSPADNVAIAA
jgi:hypothetical protein